MNILKDKYNTIFFSFLKFWTLQYALTFKPGLRFKRHQDEREDWHFFEYDSRWATSSDREVSAKALKAFLHNALSRLFGRRWHNRKDIRFTCLAIPEYRSRDGLDLVPLHYHILFGCEEIGLQIDDIEKAFEDANKYVTRRVFGYRTALYIEEVRNERKYRKYIEKNNNVTGNIDDCIVIRDFIQTSHLLSVDETI